MKRLALCVVLAACGGGGGDDGDDGDDAPPMTWDDAVDVFVAAVCMDPCAMDIPANCESDIRTDMMQAQGILDDAGEIACIGCLDAKVDTLAAIEANGCTITPAHIQAVLDACDTDDAADSNGDGDPTNDDDEACEGFP